MSFFASSVSWFSEPVTRQFVLCFPPSRAYTAAAMAESQKFMMVVIAIEMREFEDGEPNIRVPLLHSMTGRHVIYVADWSSPAARYRDLCVLTALAEMGPASLTIVVPFMGTATMERESAEGVVATANVDAKLLSQLPGANKRIITIDLHTLQNQFFFHGCVVSLKSCMPLTRSLLLGLTNMGVASGGVMAPPPVFAFPDDGAHKRFAGYFTGAEVAVCAKVRDGESRRVRLVEGNVAGRCVVIVDDLVRSGGTLIECAKVLKAAGATYVAVFVPHACFPRGEYRRFIGDGDGAAHIDRFFTTDSVARSAAEIQALDTEKFVVLPIANFILQFLEK